MPKKYIIFTVLFCVCLIASNLFETKIFNAGFLTLTGGFIIFPISYILNDVITEIYGYKSMKFAIWLAFAMNAFLVIMAQFVRILPPEQYWHGQSHFDYIFASDLRITIASMLAFVIGSNINSWVMAKMKKFQGERGFCWRAVLSSLAGEAVDSIVFFPIAFYFVGIRNMLVLMVTQILLKTLYEVLLLPVTSSIVRILKRNKSNYLYKE